jgi:hypothetical protein
MADDPERDVLSSLPRTRPARRSARRGPAAAQAAAVAGTAGGAGAAPAAVPVAAGGEPAAPPPRRVRTEPVPPAGWATPDDTPDGFGPVEAVTTVVRAVGEAAGIAVAVAANGVRSIVRRLPTP